LPADKWSVPENFTPVLPDPNKVKKVAAVKK